ncbi:TetR/AcrR family transcriptional regulator [Pseudactinotalea terrae]|uniref:TetR/AcrR family transcriptional regulator n=1 Tax=Pseudactinotalea terrae TaxID=1743262 RepID=UPI0012E1A1CC|nr:TetR/AcrR family transcriptional regulator [Pseudactinotalea terrae]
MQTTRPMRADARRNIEAIIEAATNLLATDPDASINDIAAAAGVGRVTLYGHFENRAALLNVVTERAIGETEAALGEIDLAGDPRDALGRVLEATWHLTHRFGALVVAAGQSLSPEAMRRAHTQPAARIADLLRRGRDAGEFRSDQPLEWQISTIQAIVHAASAAVHRGEIAADDAPLLVRDTALAAVGA